MKCRLLRAQQVSDFDRWQLMNLSPLAGIAALPTLQTAFSQTTKTVGQLALSFAQLLGAEEQSAQSDQQATLIREVQELFASRGIRPQENLKVTLSETGELSLSGTIPATELWQQQLNIDPDFLSDLREIFAHHLASTASGTVTLPGEAKKSSVPLFPVNRA